MELVIAKDTQDLEKLESVISKNLQSFYEVGRALMEIRDRELYRLKNGGGYQTFEAYCKGEWDFSRSYAYRLIGSANVIEIVSPTGDIQPTSERQARPLLKLEPEQQRKAWKKAVETAPDGKVTAAHVSKVVTAMAKKDQEVTKQATDNNTANIVSEDSRNLSSLKTMWNACNASDKKKFIKWVSEYFGKFYKQGLLKEEVNQKNECIMKN